MIAGDERLICMAQTRLRLGTANRSDLDQRRPMAIYYNSLGAFPGTFQDCHADIASTPPTQN